LSGFLVNTFTCIFRQVVCRKFWNLLGMEKQCMWMCANCFLSVGNRRHERIGAWHGWRHVWLPARPGLGASKWTFAHVL